MSNTASLSNASAHRELVAVILAAGKGTRMQSDIPKVMHPVLGRPMVHWVVDAARAAGATKVVLVIGHGAEMIREYFAGVPELRNTVEFVLQDKQLGTGHAVMMCNGTVAQEAVLHALGIGAGDEVDVVDGPLRGQTGVVVAVMPARDRVKVLLEFLGGTQIVELGLTAVFRPPPPALPASP